MPSQPVRHHDHASVAHRLTVALVALATALGVLVGAPAPATATSVGSPTVTVTPIVAGATQARYSVEFSLATALTAAAHDGVTVRAPTSTVFARICSVSVTDLTTGLGLNGTCIDAAGSNVASWPLPPTTTIPAGHRLRMDFDGVTNSTTPGSPSLQVTTSQDADPAFAPYSLMPGPTAVQGVSLSTSNSAPGASSVTYLVGFDSTSALNAGYSKVTITAPVGTAFSSTTCDFQITDLTAQPPLTKIVCKDYGTDPNVITLTLSTVDIPAGHRVQVTAMNTTNGSSSPSTVTVLTTSDQVPTAGGLLKLNSSTALSSSANPSLVGQSVTFTATVTGAGPTPTGSVEFRDGATVLGTRSLDDTGVATLSTSALAAGAHSITAIHAGDTMYLESTSTAHSQVVQAPTQPPPAPTGVSGTPGDGSVLVTWTAPADDGGSPIIEFVVTASPDGVTCRTTGTSCTVTGLENGTGYTFTVIAINAVGESEESTPSATITPVGPPPPVDSDSDGVADAQDQCPTQAGPAGNNGCPVVAVPPLADSDSDGVPDTQDQCPTQAGPAGNNGCPVPVVAPPDPRASSSTTLTASTTKKVTKKSKVTLTATISPPTATGTVRFSDSGHVLGTATLSGGTATLTVKGIYGGRQALVAEYLGSTQAAGSISAPVVVTVRDTARPVITQLRLRAGAASPTATFVPKDAGGIRAVQVRYRMFEPGTTRLGPWSTIEILPGQARTWTREAVPTRTRMCVSVRAIDYANKYSNWKTKCRLLIGG